MKLYIKEVELERKRISESLANLRVTVFPSFTNFLLIKTHINNISEHLAKLGVFVHDVSTQLGLEYFRVTIGSRKENDYLLESLKNLQRIF